MQWVSDLDPASYDESVFLDENKKLKEEYENYLGKGGIGAISKRLQVAYLEEYGKFPEVDWGQINGLQEIREADKLGNAVWKPIVTQDGEKILVADKQNNVGNSQAAVIYYDGKYYYHRHSTNDSNRVSYKFVDDIRFTIDELTGKDSEWVPL